MQTDQINNAPLADAPQPGEELTAAAVLRDGSAGPQPAGAASPSGAATPNSPIDAPVPQGGGGGDAQAEARLLSGGDAPEPGHESR